MLPVCGDAQPLRELPYNYGTLVPGNLDPFFLGRKKNSGRNIVF